MNQKFFVPLHSEWCMSFLDIKNWHGLSSRQHLSTNSIGLWNKKGMTMFKRTIMIWLAVTIIVMFVLPFVVARFASEDSGMVLCMMLFFIVNPIYSAILGYRCSKDIKEMWSLPLVAAVAFLAGTWIFFDIHELCFFAYAGAYLAIGWTVMFISKHL